MRANLLLQILFVGGFVLPVHAVDLLVSLGADWKYLDNGTFPGSTWMQPSFDDSLWAVGPAELGYGDGDEATVISYGPNPLDKHITTYFRHGFTVTDPAAYDGLNFRIRRDDGAAVYLNGVEVFRTNLGAGVITSQTLAASTISSSEEIQLNSAVFDPALLVAGVNVLAVEVHQRSASSSDLSFDCDLQGHTPADPVSILRGPYLQRTSMDSAVIRWRTNALTPSRVSVGTTPAVTLATFDDPVLRTDHEVEVSGLSPGAIYFYAVGSPTEWHAGPGNDYRFATNPVGHSTDPVRIWVIGDSGTADTSAALVRNAYLTSPNFEETDFWLMLGDNAYDAGTDTEYQAAVFNMYSLLLRRFPVWPTLGNHDGYTASLTGAGPYYDIFTLPTGGESGGLASGTEAYYSFDYGPVHVICLDSEGTDRNPGSAMLTWLESDLAATDRQWIIAFWHHPPYTDGSHDSDSMTDSGGRLFDMRENVLPILEDGGVDLVLCGHSHSYERSVLLDGHYGTSTTLNSSMVLDGGDGDPNGDGEYSKASGLTSHGGAVYAVAGSSGLVTAAPLNHPVMVTSQAVLGSMVLEVTQGRLDAEFLRSNGTITDRFSIVKGAQFVRGDANSDLMIDVGDAITTLSFLFQSAPVLCEVALDSNDDELLDVADPVYVLSLLFSGGSAPAAPYPNCGPDPTSGALDCATPPCP